MPDFPGAAPQETNPISVNDQIHIWGGLSCTDPDCYTNGYKPFRQDGQWQLKQLPDLLRRVAPGSVTSGSSKIYLIGDMDCDAQRYYVSKDRTKETNRSGAQMYVFYTAAPSDG